MYFVFSRGFLKLVMILPGSWRKLSTPTNSKTSRGNLQHPHIDKKARQTPLHALLWQHGLNCLCSTITSHMKTAVFHCLSLFPTSLCGVLVFGCALPPASCLPPPLLLTRSLLTYNLLTHTYTTHTHIHNSHTHNSHTHTHNSHTHTTITHTHTHTTLKHTTYSHTHTTCSHTHTHNSETHTIFTHTHTTCSHRTLIHTTLTHTTNSLSLSHTHRLTTYTQTHTKHAHTQLARLGPVVAAALCAALGDISLHFAWQAVALGEIDVYSAWKAWHSAFTSRGRRGTQRRWAGSGGALGSQLTPWTPRLFVWQAWHLATLRGRHGTWRHRCAFCVGCLALMALDRLWWRAWVPVDAVDAAAVCVAGVALGDIDVHAAWQAWHSTLAFTLRGRCTGQALVVRLGPS